MILNRDAILAAKDLTQTLLDVPEWGGSVYIRTMTAREREEWENTNFSRKTGDVELNMGRIRTSLAVAVCCDESGTRLFGDADVDALGGKSSLALERVFEKAKEVNRIGKQDVEDLAKNSGPTDGASSPSA